MHNRSDYGIQNKILRAVVTPASGGSGAGASPFAALRVVLPCGRPDDVPEGAPNQAGAPAPDTDQAGAPDLAQLPIGAPEPADAAPSSAGRLGGPLGGFAGSGPELDSQQGLSDAAAGGVPQPPALVAAAGARSEWQSIKAAALHSAADAAEVPSSAAPSPAQAAELSDARPLTPGACEVPCAAAAEGRAGCGSVPAHAAAIILTRPLTQRMDAPSHAAAARGAMALLSGSGHTSEGLGRPAAVQQLTPGAPQPACADGDAENASLEGASGRAAEALNEHSAVRPLTPSAFDESFAAEAAAVLGSLQGAGSRPQGQGPPHGAPAGALAQMGAPGGSAECERAESGGGASPGASAAAEAVVAAAAAAVGLDAEHAERLVQVRCQSEGLCCQCYALLAATQQFRAAWLTPEPFCQAVGNMHIHIPLACACVKVTSRA